MSILSSLGRIATEISLARSRLQTERALHSLPLELQKDIGWPEVVDQKIANGIWNRTGTK